MITLPSGLRMQYYELGEGPLTIFLHGFPELAVSWREQFAGLQGRRLVAPDMRGYGGTDAPAAVREYAIDRLIDDVLQLQDALGGEPMDLVGHDWGGAVAWEVAAHHPDRVRTACVLNCPPMALMQRMMWRPRQLTRSWYILWFQIPGLAERTMLRDPLATMKKVFLESAANPEPFTDEVLAPYVEQLRERGLPGLKYYRAAAVTHRRLARVQPPTRLIWGLQDTALGPWFAEPERYGFCDTFDVVTIEESGHWVQQEAPEAVNRALREHWARH